MFSSFFINFEAGPLPQRSGLELNLNVPILLKKLMKRPYIWSRAKWPSIVPIFAFPDMVTLSSSLPMTAIGKRKGNETSFLVSARVRKIWGVNFDFSLIAKEQQVSPLLQF